MNHVTTLTYIILYIHIWWEIQSGLRKNHLTPLFSPFLLSDGPWFPFSIYFGFGHVTLDLLVCGQRRWNCQNSFMADRATWLELLVTLFMNEHRAQWLVRFCRKHRELPWKQFIKLGKWVFPLVGPGPFLPSHLAASSHGPLLRNYIVKNISTLTN